jgi:hypothetical protein
VAEARQEVGEGKQAVGDLRDRAGQPERRGRDRELLDDHADDTPESS